MYYRIYLCLLYEIYYKLYINSNIIMNISNKVISYIVLYRKRWNSNI